jgi:hypothetical protein
MMDKLQMLLIFSSEWDVEMFLNDKLGGSNHNLLQGTSLGICLKGLRKAAKPSASPGASADIWILYYSLFVYSCFILGIGIVSIALGYGLDGPGFFSQQGKIFLLSTASILALGPMQSPI